MTRILVYSHDTFGLGNIRRMIRISEALVERDPDVSVLVVTGSPMLHAFRLPPNIDYVKLPCLARDIDGSYGVKHLDIEFDTAVQMRSQLIRESAIGFTPDVVIVDKKPLGVAGELAPMLDALVSLPNPPSIHLLLRDILDTPEATQAVWKAHGYHDAIAEYYDSVLVVGERDIFNVGEAYAFPPETREKLFYCGYINRAKSLPAGQQMQRNARPKVLIHAGGGQDGPALIEAAIGAINIDGITRGFDCTIVGGPELGEADREKLSSAASRLHDVEWLDFTDSMGQEIAAADLVVSMGGYNSVCEILGYRKRAIIVPRSYPVREQRIRAEAMDKLGLLKMLPLEQLSAVRLNQEIHLELSLCNVVNSRTARIGFNGLDKICDRLLGARFVPVHAAVTPAFRGVAR